MNNLPHVRLELFDLEFSLGVETNSLLYLLPNFIFNMAVIIRTITKDSAKLIPADTSTAIDVQSLESLLEIALL